MCECMSMKFLRDFAKKIWILVPENTQKRMVLNLQKNSLIPKGNQIAEVLSERLGYKEVREYAFYLNENFQEEIKKIKANPVYIKVNLDYAWGFFHAGIIIQVIEYTILAMKRNMIPIFYVNDRIKSHEYLCLDWFIEQPYLTVFQMDELDLDSIVYIEDTIEKIPYRIEADYLWKSDKCDWQLFRGLAKKIISKNNFLSSYIENDKRKNNIIPNDLLGVIIRGTDYVKLRPKYHPVQPDVKEVIDKVHELMNSGEYKGIYVATDEKRVFEYVKDEFGRDVVYSNTREYYDDIYRKDNLYQISDAKLQRENDQFYNSLEYISSMFILSECKSIVGGNCTGGMLAALFSDNAYLYFFNKGLY